MKYTMDESKKHERTEKIKGAAEMKREYGSKTKKRTRKMTRKGEKMPFA